MWILSSEDLAQIEQDRKFMENYFNSSEHKAYSTQNIERAPTGEMVQAIMDWRNIIEENVEKLFISPRAGE